MKYFHDEKITAQQAWSSLAVDSLKLQLKEALAVMHGTAVMSALACLCFLRASYLCRLSSWVSMLAMLVLKGNLQQLSERLFAVKPHPGMQRVAHWMRLDPHKIGCLADALPWMRQLIEVELNSVNDNPVVDPEVGQLWRGGHFYGGRMAMAMDTSKVQVANLADSHGRQLGLLTDVRYSEGLLANLVGQTGERIALCHGFKGIHISCSAWTAEALKLTMPASVFSRSAECHNQDKVSMGTLAARDCWRILQLTEQVVAATLMAAVQAFRLRVR